MGTITIGDSCEVLNGYAFKSEKYTSSGIRVIRIANVQKGYIEDDSPVFYQTADVDLNKYMLRENDLLVSLTGNVGRTALLTKDMLPAALNQRVACLRLKTNKITRGFLFHLLNSDYFESKCIQSSQGVAQKNLSTEWLKSYDLPLYSLSKQNEITKILDNVRNTIVLKKQEIQKYDELIKARFVEMFGEPVNNPKKFEKRSLKDTCKIVTGNTPSRAVEEYYGDFVEWIKTDNIISGEINPTRAVEYLSEEGMKVGRVVEEDAILMACIAGSIASIGRVCVTDRTVAFNQQINAIVPYDYNQLFLYVLLQISKDYLIEDVSMALKGILSKSKLEEKEFIVPPIELQNQFADFVRQVDKSREAVKKSLEKTQQLYDSLMQEYFG